MKTVLTTVIILIVLTVIGAVFMLRLAEKIRHQEHERAAEEMERLRLEFSSNASHKLRTPLQTISGYSELIARGFYQGEEVIEAAEQINQAAKDMSDLVDRVLRMSNLNSSIDNVMMERVNLSEIAEGVVNSLRDKAAEHGVSMGFTGAPVKVTGSRKYLETLVYELVLNGIQYNREGGSVEVTVEKPAAGRGPALSVKDTGAGIPEEDRDRVFETFYQVDKSGSSGNGIGLPVVKLIARKHNAKIKLSGAEGGGTEVRVTFP